VSRAVATTSDGKILLAGGLNVRGASRASVVWIRPSNGRVVRSGRLPVATHDFAGWAARGGLLVAGGGNISSVATVEQVLPSGAARVVGSLPRPRSDSVAAEVGRTAYIVGGYDGAVLDPAVLASSDAGKTFRRVARLPVPVRYPAVATTGATLWVVGGQTAHGLTNVVQRVDTVSGEARIAGRLPTALDAATARAIGGQLIVAGGATPKGTTSAILTCAIPTVRCKVTGRLPFAVQNAAVATVAGRSYLLGGERNGAVLDDVATIDYTRR
jgi:hypothetical protein